MERSIGDSGRLPWWMYVVVLSYIVTFGLIFYLIFWGPSELRGFVNAFSDGAMVIESVNDPDSPVARGGLRAGDRVLMIDDRPVRTVRDWTEATGDTQAGRPQQWVVSRGSDRITLEMVPARITLQSRLVEGYVQYLSHLLISAFLGLLIAWKRPGDPVARIGAGFLLTVSLAFGFPFGWAVPWRAVPWVLQLFAMDPSAQPVCARRNLPLILCSFPTPPGHAPMDMVRNMGACACNGSLAG